MNKNIINYRIMMILKEHLLDSISINEFIEMTDSLSLEVMDIKLRDAIIEDAKEKVFKIKSDSEWELLEFFVKEVRKYTKDLVEFIKAQEAI